MNRVLQRTAFVLAFASQVLANGAPMDEVKTFQSTYDGTTQPYRLFLPEAGPAAATTTRPLLVVLHGKGVDHHAWFNFTPVKDHAGRRGYVVAAPLGRGDWFYRGPGEQDVLDTIAEVKRLIAIDPDRVYLAGHSMGGWGTWWIALRNPDLFASIVPMAGWAPPGTHGDPATGPDLLGNALHLDPLIIHDADDPILPVSESQAAAAALARAGISHALRVERGYGHASKMIGDNFDRIFAWFETRRRAAQPDTVRFSTRSPARGRAYWVEIMETARFPEYATVEASVASTGTVKIVARHARTLRLHLDAMPRGTQTTAPIRVQLDGQTFEASPGDKTLCLRTEAPTGTAWRRITDDEAEAARRNSPAFQTVSDHPIAGLPDDATSESLAAAVAGALQKRGEFGTLALPVALFRRPPGTLTRDKLLDVCLIPDDRLAAVEMNSSTLLALDGSEIVPYGTIRIYGNKPTSTEKRDKMTVWMPQFLATRLVDQKQAQSLPTVGPSPTIARLLAAPDPNRPEP